MGDAGKNKKVESFKSECLLFLIPFSRVGSVYPNFWDYLYDIVAQKPHEQHSVQNGVVFTKSFEEKDFSLNNNSFEIRDYYLDNSSDGRSVFCLISNDSTSDQTLIFHSELTQQDILSFAGIENSIVIITRSNMEIRVFYHGTISVFENRDWMIYQNKNEIRSRLYSKLITSSQIERFLVFAYYDLAISKIGTSLVLHTDNNPNWSGIKYKEMKKDIDLSKDLELALLKEYARTHDGAIIINFDNRIAGINAKLTPEEETIQAIEEKYHFGGMRHTFSCAYTYEHPDTVIITTSDDGGATVFSKGEIVLSNKFKEFDSQEKHQQFDYSVERLNFTSISRVPSQKQKKNTRSKSSVTKNMHLHLESFQKMAEEYGESSEIEYTTTKCPKCKQQYIVGYIRIVGWNNHEELKCKNCGTVYYSKSCFELVGEPILEEKARSLAEK